MRNALRAEILKLTTRRVVLGTLIVTLVFSIGAAAIVLLSASDDPRETAGRTATIAGLSNAGGATQAFSLGASFFGFFTFVLFLAVLAGEFGQGTVRTMLMREPRRMRFLAGRMTGLLLFVAGAVAVALVLSVMASIVLAPTQDVSRGNWLTADGIIEATEDYGTVLVGAGAWALYAMMLAVIVRSVPIALGIGIAWAGPFEHLIGQSYTGLGEWFPGLLLEALAAGGANDISSERALALTAVYVVIAATIGTAIFARRDIAA